jgi:hypothetical protein
MGVLTATSGYSGEVLGAIKRKLSTGNEIMEKSLANLIPTIEKQVYIPRFKAANLLGGYIESPTTSQGTSTFDDKPITPGSFTLYHEFNPRVFEQVWKRYQPQGQIVFRNLPPEVQREFFMLIMETTLPTINQALLTGDDTTPVQTDPLTQIDGLETILANDGDVLDVASPTTLTNGNIVDEIEKLWAATPVAVRRHPDWKILVNTTTEDLYQQAIYNNTYKGNDFTSSGPMTYRGKQIVSLVGMSDNKMIGIVANPTISSNLHIAVDWNRDSLGLGESVILVDRVSNASVKYFVRADFKMGINVAFGEEVTGYGL